MTTAKLFVKNTTNQHIIYNKSEYTEGYIRTYSESTLRLFQELKTVRTARNNLI